MVLKIVNSVIVAFVLIILELIELGNGELRFCLNGPHRMKDDDCPGGFIFKESVKPTCKFYAKTGNHSGIVLGAPIDLCDDKTVRMIDDAEDDLADIDQFTWFIWEDMEGNSSMKGSFNPPNVCMDECLPEWQSESIPPDEDPVEENFDPSSVSDEMKASFSKLNMEMFLQLIMDEDVERKDGQTIPLPKVPPGEQPLPEPPTNDRINAPPTNIDRAESSLITGTPMDSSQSNVIKLLARSFKVAVSACSPFVREEFYEQLLKGMIFITKAFQGKALDLGMDLYMGIARILDHCGLKHQQDFMLNGTKCEGKEKVDGIYYPRKKLYWPYRLTGRSFRWGKYHPILDATWTTIDLIQSFCFESFMKNMMLSHVYHLAMEELFPSDIQLLWRLNPDIKNDKFWNNLMQTYDLNVTMKNLDACAVAARNSSPFQAPLPRPFLTMADLEKPAPEPKAPPEPRKGWNKTMEQYWKLYEKQGGFRKISEKFGKCFHEHHTDEQNDMLEALKTRCS